MATLELSETITDLLAGKFKPRVSTQGPLGGGESDLAAVLAKSAVNMAGHTASALKPRKEFGADRLKDKILWASELGEGCRRKLWYKFHWPEAAEPIPGEVKFKFAYGNIIEEMALLYATAAGYKVMDQQHLMTEVLPNGWTVRGRIDAVVEHPRSKRRAVLDVKSCSSAAFAAYKQSGPELNRDTDSFGYIQQLGFYDNNRNVLLHDHAWSRAEFLFIDKQLGRMHSASYSPGDVNYRVEKGGPFFDRQMQDGSNLPSRGYTASPDGVSGNKKLGMACSYCAFKVACWPGLRAFKYSTGPKFLTEVVQTPRVPEIPLQNDLIQIPAPALN